MSLTTKQEITESLGRSDVPEHLHYGLIQYIAHGYIPGDFLTAVLEHELFKAIGHADDYSQRGLVPLVQWIYCHAPGNCHGSRKLVEEYTKTKREELNTAIENALN